MPHSWFVPYHAYSVSFERDDKALRHFEEDVKFAQELDVKYIIMEDYYAKLTWGEYLTLWNEYNFRKMIKIMHDYGMIFLPYVCATELATKGEVYKTKGKEWGAKNRWGKVYTGFCSIYLPVTYPPKYDFISRLMCPGSGWHDYLCDQVEQLQDQYEVDGIYIDRIDYRVTCFDHSHDRDHFNKGILELMKSIKNRVKKFGSSQACMMNDSCMNPDEIMGACMKAFDFVLSELLPIDWDPHSLYNRIQQEWGNLVWPFRRLLRPGLSIFTEWQFNQGTMTSLDRIRKIVKRIAKYRSPDEIFLFSHKKDLEGLKALENVAKKTGANLGYFTGMKRLSYLKSHATK